MAQKFKFKDALEFIGANNNDLDSSQEESPDYSTHTEIINHIKNLVIGEIESTVGQNIKDVVYTWLSDYKDTHPEDFIVLLAELKLILNQESSREAQQALEVIKDLESKNNFK